MNTPQTPGPWRSTTPPSCLLTTRQIRTEHDELIADVGTPGENGVGTIQNVANARLIAASPELLAALQNLENDDGSIPDHAWKLVQDAITKATGQTP